MQSARMLYLLYISYMINIRNVSCQGVPHGFFNMSNLKLIFVEDDVKWGQKSLCIYKSCVDVNASASVKIVICVSMFFSCNI